MNSMMLVLAMSAGQGPAGGYSPATPGNPYSILPVQNGGMPPAVMPGAVPMAMQPGVGAAPVLVPAVPNGVPVVNGNGNGAAAPAPEEPAAEGPPVYLLERTLRETWLGKKMADHNIRLYGWTAMSYTFRGQE